MLLCSKGLQIVTKECLPFQEIKENPYVVLCTTALGGHVGWFEIGSGRWFAKPVSRLALSADFRIPLTVHQPFGFLNALATKIDLDRIEKSDEICKPEVDRHGKSPTEFDPMIRKLHVEQT